VEKKVWDGQYDDLFLDNLSVPENGNFLKTTKFKMSELEGEI
jgi:hypothetical protein